MKKISIIIPTFNRVHLLEETMNSILAQTYENWECLIVDDGSTDDSQKVFNRYADLDSRFLFFKRPPSKRKGANACRNIGLEKATGNYVIFFDSDDLMTENHLEIKLNAIEKHNCDYIITRTKYFNKDNSQIDTYYQFDKYEITPFNYISQKINWLTYDILIKSDLAKNMCFNENLQSGQEYNYFSKLVHYSCNGKFVDKVVTLRRYHENSVRAQLKIKSNVQVAAFRVNWFTYVDLKGVAEEKILKFLLIRCVEIVYENKAILISNKLLFCCEIFKNFKIKGGYFMMMYLSLKLFNKGYFFKSMFLKE